MADTDLNVVGPDGRTPAEPGYDHRWFPFSPLPMRPAPEWPGRAAVAVTVVLDLGAVEWDDDDVTIAPLGGRGRAPRPDFPRASHREFGHRVGVFRVLRMLEEQGIPVAVAVDVLTVEHYQPLLDRLVPVASEFLAGGLSASRPITSRMSEEEERHYIGETMRRLEQRLPARPTGWLGPGRGESARTPALLAEAGLGYVADWCNDDLPYPFHGAAAGLWALPLSWELSDVGAMFERGVSPWSYARSVRDAVEQLRTEAAPGGRALGLHLSPWLAGQAFRADAVEEVLADLAASDGVWLTTPQDIVSRCRTAS